MITTIQELNQTRDDCYALVQKRARLSATASAIPVVGLDIAADVGILLQLVPEINERFGLSKQQVAEYSPAVKEAIAGGHGKSGAGMSMVGAEITKTLITYALRKIAARAVKKQVLKFVPFLGWAVNAVIGFRAMKFVGNSHVDDCYDAAKRVIESQYGYSPT
ncbi:MAG: hypothetical protein V4695_00345 [Pseudomonadota bacterium]